MMFDPKQHPSVKQRFRAFINDRSLEWLSSLAMLWWGICLAWPGDTLAGPAFVAFHRYGLTETFWACVFGGAGAMGVAALYINGRWPKGPKVRMARALFGALSWSQVAWLLAEGTIVKDGVASPGIGIYALLALSDLFSIHRAAFDARYYDS